MKASQFAKPSFALAAFLGLSMMAQAQQVCSTSTVVGRYISVCNGFDKTTAGFVPVAAVGNVENAANGDTTVTGASTVGGTSARLSLQSVGPLQINPDCSGSVAFSPTGQAPATSHFDFFVANLGRTINMIQTDAGATLTCTLTRH